MTEGAFVFSGRSVTWASFGKSPLVEGGSYHDDPISWAKFSDLGRFQLRWLADNAPRREDKESALPRSSIEEVGRILRRFRQCCQYFAKPLEKERDVQDVVWIMLRSHFDRLDREDTLKRFGVKKYVPDFGIPELQLLIEVKFIGEATKPSDIQEELLADVPGYLQAGSGYTRMLALVYDAAHKLRDERKFREDLLTISGITDVIVVPGMG